MVSASRTWEKIRRIEEKILAYAEILASGKNPEAANVITSIPQERLNRELWKSERIRYKQNIVALEEDLRRNVDKLGLKWKQYLADAKQRKIDKQLQAALSLPTEKEKGE